MVAGPSWLGGVLLRLDVVDRQRRDGAKRAGARKSRMGCWPLVRIKRIRLREEKETLMIIKVCPGFVK